MKHVETIIRKLLKSLRPYETQLSKDYSEYLDRQRKPLMESECRDAKDYIRKVLGLNANMREYFIHPLVKLQEEVDRYSYSIVQEMIKEDRTVFTKESADGLRIHDGISNIKRDFLWDGFKMWKTKEVISKCRQKLIATINKKLKGLDVKSLEELFVRQGQQGFEGEWIVTLGDGTKRLFEAKSIYAGGYNIQRFHFRYLTYLKEVKR